MAKNSIQEKKEVEFFKKSHEKDVALRNIIKYLDLSSGTPNIGTRNKRILMERTLVYLVEWHSGTYDEWINRLSLRLNLTVRTVRENYVDPLISEGIVRKTGSQVVFVGIPD